jgi:hypothetical protein
MVIKFLSESYFEVSVKVFQVFLNQGLRISKTH